MKLRVAKKVATKVLRRESWRYRKATLRKSQLTLLRHHVRGYYGHSPLRIFFNDCTLMYPRFMFHPILLTLTIA